MKTLLECVNSYSYSHLPIAFQNMGISPMPIKPGPPTPTAPPLPTTTTIQGSKKFHETPVTTHDPEITKMATEETTQEITSTEPDVPKRKNDSIYLLYRIVCFNIFTLSREALSIYLHFSRSVSHLYKTNT